jgi:hypothetical protein
MTEYERVDARATTASQATQDAPRERADDEALPEQAARWPAATAPAPATATEHDTDRGAAGDAGDAERDTATDEARRSGPSHARPESATGTPPDSPIEAQPDAVSGEAFGLSEPPPPADPVEGSAPAPESSLAAGPEYSPESSRESSQEPGPEAAAEPTAGSTPSPAPASLNAADEELLPADRREQWHLQWREVQASFVDDPHSAVERADALVGEALSALTERLNARREALTRNWRDSDRGGDAAPDTGEAGTEALRLALQRYRRLLDSIAGPAA